MNDKRIWRLWRNAGLCVTQTAQGPLRGIDAQVRAICTIPPNAFWALDSRFNTTTTDGRTLGSLNVFDEFTREALAVDIDEFAAGWMISQSQPAWRLGHSPGPHG